MFCLPRSLYPAAIFGVDVRSAINSLNVSNSLCVAYAGNASLAQHRTNGVFIDAVSPRSPDV